MKKSSKLCFFFSTERGCDFGDRCINIHDLPQKSSELCTYFASPKGCRFGDKCINIHASQTERLSKGDGGGAVQLSTKVGGGASESKTNNTGKCSLLLGPGGLPVETPAHLVSVMLNRFLPENLRDIMTITIVATEKSSDGKRVRLEFPSVEETEAAFKALSFQPVFTAMLDGSPIELELLSLGTNKDKILSRKVHVPKAQLLPSSAEAKIESLTFPSPPKLTRTESIETIIGKMQSFFIFTVYGREMPLTLQLVRTDITRWRGDAIVNAANESLLGGGGVDGAIHTAAGSGLVASCRKIELLSPGVRCLEGNCVLTKGPFGPELGAPNVIHAVGPRATSKNRGEKLSNVYFQALSIAAEENFMTVAFPSISTGIFNYPKEEAASVAINAISAFARQGAKKVGSLIRIDMCLLDAQNYKVWCETGAEETKASSSDGLVGVGTPRKAPPVRPQSGRKAEVGGSTGTACIILHRFRRKLEETSPPVEQSEPFKLEILVGLQGSVVHPFLSSMVLSGRELDAALEALNLATANLIPTSTMTVLAETLANSDRQCLIGGNITAFLLDISSIPSSAESLDQLPSTFKNWRFKESKDAPKEWKKFNSLHWIEWNSTEAVAKIAQKVKSRHELTLHDVLHKNDILTSKLIEIFTTKAKTSESEAIALLGDQLQATIKSAEAELPGVQLSVCELRVETDPVPEPSPSFLPQDLMPLDSSSEEFLNVKTQITGGKVPMRVRKVNVLERSQRFDAYVQTLGSKSRPTITVRTYHGTPQIKFASSIARNGPNLSLAGTTTGKAYGSGFYTDKTSPYPESIAGNGSVLVATVAPGRATQSGDQSTTAASLTSQGFDSVAPDAWHILFHPDAVRIDYIADFSTEGDEEKEVILAAHAAAVKERDKQEMIRKANLQKAESRITMIQQYIDTCKKLALDLNTRNIPMRVRLAFLEATQFKQGLPMYAQKTAIVQMIRENGCCIIKGGTGTGKTVSVPQWVYDEVFFSAGKPGGRVAVLVPRRAIAEGLAEYISKTRRVPLGTEVGVGVSGNVQFDDSTRLLFATYGFFRAISLDDEHFSKWDALLLDEAHERNVDADFLMPLMVKATLARPNFRAVVMSATIDVEKFAGALSANMGGAHVPTLSIEGVTFPVEDIWADSVWDPLADGAIVNLCSFVILVFRTEGAGNILCFLPTIAAVEEAVESTRKSMAHDPNVVVKPLFAALDAWEKNEVEFFTDIKNYPGNEGKRLICFSTNVAEAGITIPGIAAVVETGHEIDVRFDPTLRVYTTRCAAISKASQIQRRGRAGRTAPGKCYCTYPKSFFEEMKEYSDPSVTKIDLQPLYLNLLRAGFDPLATEGERSVSLLDAPQDRLEEAKARLLGIEAIQAGRGGAGMIVTPLGDMLSRLPLDFSLCHGLIASSTERLSCSVDFAIIAAVASFAIRGGIFEKNASDEQIKAFASANGDMITYLNVYNEWVARDKDPEWCEMNGVRQEVLDNASDLLVKIHRSMSSAKPPIPLREGTYTADGNSESLMRALIVSFSDNVAQANDSSKLKAGFTLLQDFTTDPIVDAFLNRGSLGILKQSTSPIKNVIYQAHSRSSKGRKSLNSLSGVTALPEGLLEDELKHFTSSKDLHAEFKKTLRSMERKAVTLSIGDRIESKHVAAALTANIIEAQYEFPLAQVKLHCDNKNLAGATITIRTPSVCFDTVMQRVEEAIESAQFGKASVNLDAKLAKEYFKSDSKLTEEGNALQADIKKIFSTHVELKYDGHSLQIKCLAVVLNQVVKRISSRLGVVPPQVSSLSLSPVAASRIGTRPSMNMEERIDYLMDSSAGSADRIKYKFGDGKIGCMLVLANFIVGKTDMSVYGGYLRDFICRGDTHPDMDIDIALPIGKGHTIKDGLRELLQFASTRNIECTRQNGKGSDVIEAFLKAPGDNEEFTVEIVDSEKFAEKDNRIDFDVNNLKVGRSSGCKEMQLKRPEQSGPLVEVVSHAAAKSLVILKPATEVSARIAKMQSRGWNCEYP